MNDPQLEKLNGLLKNFSTVMLITLDNASAWHARPMAVAKVDENSDLWLFTSRDSDKVRQIEANSCVQVHGQEGWENCIVLTGHATVVDNRAMIREIWKPSFKAWFPDGAEDSHIVLLHIKSDEAEYWDNTGTNRFRYLYQSLKALVTKSTPEIKEGEQHGKVKLPR